MGSLSRLLGVPRPGFSSYLLHSVDKIYSHDFMGFIRFDDTRLPVSKLFRYQREVEFFLPPRLLRLYRLARASILSEDLASEE